MKIAVMFSGQGAQCVGMGLDWYENNEKSKMLFERANELLDWDLKAVCFTESDGKINQTRYTQGALFVTSVAGFEALKEAGIKVEAVLGFSLGEYSAFVASGAIDFEEALRLVDQRACYMDACTNQAEDGMAAVIGLDYETIKSVCEATKDPAAMVQVANDNCPGQTIISGKKIGISNVTPHLKELGAKRVIPLNVSGAFHSNFMLEAANQIKQALDGVLVKEPKIPIVGNVTADYMTKNDIVENIPKQIISAVRFRESIMKLIEDGFDTFIEVGAKKTLCSFVEKISSDVQTFHASDISGLEKIITALEEAQ